MSASFRYRRGTIRRRSAVLRLSKRVPPVTKEPSGASPLSYSSTLSSTVQRRAFAVDRDRLIRPFFPPVRPAAAPPDRPCPYDNSHHGQPQRGNDWGTRPPDRTIGR